MGWATGLAILLAAAAAGVPAPGARLPNLQASDVNGQERSLRTLASAKPRTLVVAIVDRNDAEAMRAWFEASDRKAPRAGRISIVSIHVPFFVSDDYARSKAREEIPEKWRPTSLLDIHGKMAKELGLEGGGAPWVFAVDANGKVLAAAHGPVDGEGAQAIWRALGTGKGADQSADQSKVP